MLTKMLLVFVLGNLSMHQSIIASAAAEAEVARRFMMKRTRWHACNHGLYVSPDTAMCMHNTHIIIGTHSR